MPEEMQDLLCQIFFMLLWFTLFNLFVLISGIISNENIFNF